MRVLVVDDEPAVRTALERALRLEGYDVELAADGAEALHRVSLHSPDAVVLDVLMPNLDGLEVCRRLRAADDHTPVLMLTARDAVGDRVAGLDAGADDYFVKPFALEELHARLRALLRRAAGTDTDVLRFSDVTLDIGTREVRRGERRIELTRTEFLLLELFLRNAKPGADPLGDLRPRLGLRLRAALERARGLRQLPPPQAGGRRRAPADPHRARRRLRSPRAVTFRTRLALASAIAVAAAIAAASLVSYGLVRAQLRGSIDDALRARARQVQIPVSGRLGEFGLPDPLLGGAGGYAQLVTASGGVFRRPDAKIPLPSVGARQVAAGTRDPYFEDATVADTRVRILTAKYADGIAIQIARPLDEVDKTLDRLAGFLTAISAAGIALAAHPRTPRLAHRRLAGPTADRNRGARDRDTRPQPADRDARQGRARASRRQLQLDAQRARRLASVTDAADRRRLARAAHAAHEPADERRGPPARERSCRRTSGRASSPRSAPRPRS